MFGKYGLGYRRFKSQLCQNMRNSLMVISIERIDLSPNNTFWRCPCGNHETVRQNDVLGTA